MRSESEQLIANSSKSLSRRALNWESTLIDKIIFPVTALVFLILFTILLIGNIGNKTDGSPSYEAICWTRPEFSGMWALYTNEYCASERAELSVAPTEEIPTHRDRTQNNRPSRDNIFPTTVPKNGSTVKSSKLLLFLVLLSLIPPFAWHLLKGIDGNGLATLEHRKRGTRGRGSAGYFTMFWYTFCQVLMLIVIVVIYLFLNYHMESNFTQKKNSLYESNVTDLGDDLRENLRQFDPNYSEEPKWVQPGRVDEETVLCTFRIRRLGQNLRTYTVQCNLKRTVASSYEYLVLVTAQYWTTLVVAAIIINTLVTGGLALLAFAKNSVVAWYLGYKVSPTFSALVNWPDVYVGLLASRRGETRQVVEIFTNASESISQQEELMTGK